MCGEGRAGQQPDRSCCRFREPDCVLTEQDIRTHRYILLKLFILAYKAVIWVRKLKRIHTPLEERPCPSQCFSFYLMTCNRSSHGCHLSTSVLFLVRPARGAGAQLHHGTWARETGSSGVQRPTQPRLQETLSPKDYSYSGVIPPSSSDTPRGRFKKKTFKDSAVNFSSVFVTNGKNIIIFNSFPLKITCYILQVLFHNSDKESGSLVIEQECRKIPSLDKSYRQASHSRQSVTAGSQALKLLPALVRLLAGVEITSAGHSPV